MWLTPKSVTDPYSGKDADSWDDPNEVEQFDGCILWPEPSIESSTDPARPSHLISGLSLTVPFGTQVRAGHRFKLKPPCPYAGVWQVDGLPGHWESPWGEWRPGTVVKLIGVEG